MHRFMPTLPAVSEERPSEVEEAEPVAKKGKRRRIGLPNIIADPLFGHYNRGYGGLGLPTLLLRFKYKDVPKRVQQKLDDALLHK